MFGPTSADISKREIEKMDGQSIVEFSNEELLAQNQALSEELSQCQKDKDFVWSLWKNLQVEKPDMTNIISSIVEREQQKSDAKDLKVLNILQQKDQQIKFLQEIGADLQAQLKQANDRLSDLLVDQSNWNQQIASAEEEIKKLKDNLNHKDELLSVKELVETKSREAISQLKGSCNDIIAENEELKRTIESFKRVDKQKVDEIDTLSCELHDKMSELSVTKKKLTNEKKSYDELCGKEGELETNLEDLKKELNRKITELDDVQENLEVCEEQIKSNVRTISELNERLEQYQHENLDLQKELEEGRLLSHHVSEQSELIKNLESLQDDTQKVLANQQVTHQQEIEAYQKTISESTKKISKLQHACQELMRENKKNRERLQYQKKLLSEKELIINELNDTNERIETAARKSPVRNYCTKCSETGKELDECHQSYDHLMSNYTEKCKQLSDLQQQQQQQQHVVDHDGYERRNVSTGFCETENQHKFKPKPQNETINFLNNLVNSMKAELQTTRTAHNQRLQRYKLLQDNYNLVLEQLSTYEEGSILTPRREEKLIHRASQKSLQREESQSVWNELEYFKREYQKLNKERPKLKEELDDLRVKASSDCTIINNLKLQVSELHELLSRKDDKIASSKQDATLISSQSITYKKQIELWKEKCSDKEDARDAIEVKYLGTLQNEKLLQQENSLLVTELQSLKREMERDRTEASTQTVSDDNYGSKQLLEKMNALMDVVQSDKLTISQLDSQNSTLASSYTQTMPNKVRFTCNEKSIQTDEASDGREDIRNEKVKRKQMKLTNETQRLLLLKSDLQNENRSLKKRVVSLENQAAQLREAKNSMGKEMTILENANEKLKSELVNSLHKLQATREILQDRSSELEKCSQEFETLSKQQKDEQKSSVDVAIELRTMQAKLREVSIQSSKSAVQLTSIEHENALLTQKLKQSQERVMKLEKVVSQKKTFIDDLKEKYNDTKAKIEDDTGSKETITKKLKLANERESKNKTYIEQLKNKVDVLTKDKMLLRDTLTNVELDLSNKSRLLQESQRLCRNAESAITEMEQTAYEQLKHQHEGFSGKEKVIKTRYGKTMSQVNELKEAVTNFSESLLSQIHENRSYLAKKLKDTQQKKQDSMLEDKAKTLACSILNMSTSDLEDFMKDDFQMEGNLKKFEDNDVRAKLDAILKKEGNFGKVLAWFLMDLVNYNFRIFQELSHF